jgi:nucleoid-associated protein YgaU
MVSFGASVGAGASIGAVAGPVGAVAGAAVGAVVSVMSGGVNAMIRCLNPYALGLVMFDFNPNQIQIARASAGGNKPTSNGGASSYILSMANPPSITINKIVMTGETTKLRVDQLLSWCGPPAGLFTALAKAVFGGPVSSAPPDLTFQWGPPMVGFMYDVVLKNVTATYTRFHTTGIPIRAEVNLTMTVQPSLLASFPTNPTSGGLPGRSAHMVRSGETLQSIAQNRYGNPGAWRRIAEINKIDNPSRVRPGTTVYLPSEDELKNGAR